MNQPHLTLSSQLNIMCGDFTIGRKIRSISLSFIIFKTRTISAVAQRHGQQIGRGGRCWSNVSIPSGKESLWMNELSDQWRQLATPGQHCLGVRENFSLDAIFHCNENEIRLKFSRKISVSFAKASSNCQCPLSNILDTFASDRPSDQHEEGAEKNWLIGATTFPLAFLFFYLIEVSNLDAELFHSWSLRFVPRASLLTHPHVNWRTASLLFDSIHFADFHRFDSSDSIYRRKKTVIHEQWWPTFSYLFNFFYSSTWLLPMSTW